MEQPAAMAVPGPMREAPPTVTYGPRDAEASTTASCDTIAVACSPGVTAGFGYNAATTRAKAARGSAARINVRPAGNSTGTIRQPALDSDASALALRFATKES